MHFIVDGIYFNNSLELQVGDQARVFGGRPWEWEASLVPLNCQQGGSSGVGIAQLWYQYQGECPVPNTPR